MQYSVPNLFHRSTQVVITIICINHLLQFSESFFAWIGARVCDIFKAIFALPESENDISAGLQKFQCVLAVSVSTEMLRSYPVRKCPYSFHYQ